MGTTGAAVLELTDLNDPRCDCAAVRFRIAAPDEFDLLRDIDLDASRLFEQAGLFMMPPYDQELLAAEHRRWTGCLGARSVLLAESQSGETAGFMALDTLDGEPYLEQLSVRMRFMRRGIGSALLAAAQRTAERRRARNLWLTTYGHLAWNRPFYERAGFRPVPTEQWGDDIAQEMVFQHRVLPAPTERIVMRKHVSLVPGSNGRVTLHD
jgi:GNAT superfamily N-acetyltransferase